MAVAVSNSLMFFAVLIFMPLLAKSFDESSKLVNIHLFFVPEKELNSLQSLNDQNNWNFFKNKGNARWHPLHLLRSKNHNSETQINPKGVNEFRIEYRQFPIGDKHKGLEVMLKNVLVHHNAKEGHFNVVRFYKDCSKFLSKSSDTKPKPGTDESKRIDSTDDGVPLLLPYDSKFSSSLENTIIKYVPYRDDGTLQLSPLNKSKRKEMPKDRSTINGCIQINWESLVDELNNLQTKNHKRTLLSNEKLNGNTISPRNRTSLRKRVSEFSFLVRLLGLKIPNDSENVNMTLVRELLSVGNDTPPVNDFHFPIPKVFHQVKSKNISSQTSLKDVLKKISKEPGKENENAKFAPEGKAVPADDSKQMLSAKVEANNVSSVIDTTILKKLKLKAIDQELQFLKRNLSTLLGNKKTKRRHRHSAYFRHHHRRHRHRHRRHHRNRFKKLHYLLNNDERPEEEAFSSQIHKNPMGDYLVDNEDQTQPSKTIFNENEPGPSFPYQDNKMLSLQDPTQDESNDAERLQGNNEDENLPSDMGLKLDPGPEMFAPKLGVPDLKPYLHDELDKETKEANTWSDRYNDADITEAKRLSRFEEDTIMRQALGFPGEGNTALGPRQQDFPFITGESQQAPQQDEVESLNERIPQDVPSMGDIQDENPSVFNRDSPATMAWNRPKENPSLVYQNNVPASFVSNELNMMSQRSGPFRTKQFPSMMSPYGGPLGMNYANEGMPVERGFARHELEPLPQRMQNPYERNMFGASLPFSTEQQNQQAYVTTGEPEENFLNPFQVWTRNQRTQANPLNTFGAMKKKKKRSKTPQTSPSPHNKTLSV